MEDSTIDYLIIGPAHPFRGGIAETQHELAFALLNQGKKVALLTFTKLYPDRLFPGKTQKSNAPQPSQLEIVQQLHAYNPFHWKRTVETIKKINPKTIVFRYYTPFLSPAYCYVAKKLPNNIKKIALVDNWIPHEPRIFDRFFNLRFGKQMNAFTTLSETVGQQIEKEFTTPLWKGFHPIGAHLLPKISKKDARKQLQWSDQQSIVLFFGIIRKYKGLELLIKAFAEEILNREDVLLYIAGECYENSKKYTALVANLKIQNKVTFYFNYQNKEAIQLLFSGADVVAQTYHTASQSGVTPLAYFYQTPLLVTNIEGLKSPVEKDQSGLCAEKNSNDIAAKLKVVLNPEHLKIYQKNIEKALPNYSWQSFAKAWDAFISAV